MAANDHAFDHWGDDPGYRLVGLAVVGPFMLLGRAVTYPVRRRRRDPFTITQYPLRRP